MMVMRSRLIALAAALVLVLPAAAQMRSSIGPGAIGRPLPPGGISGPRFGNHVHRGNRFGGTIIYPGFYDGFYDDGYSRVVEQPAPVVVVRDEQPSAPAPVPQLPPADPKVIDVPQSLVRTVPAANVPSTAIFIFADGKRLEAQNYTVTDKLVTIKEAHRPAVQFPLDQLNLDATLSENHARGLDLQLPEGRSEILISF
jgi:hypothetical protein